MALPTGVLYAMCVAVPSLAFLAAEKAVRVLAGERPSSLPAGITRPRRPLERLARDLGRLDAELMALSGSQTFARHHHRESTQLAYDDVLCECARVLEVVAPERPFSDAVRRRLEIDLQRAGLRW